MSKFNSAGKSGDFLFGGLIDRCRIVALDEQTDKELFVWELLYTVLMDKNILKIDSNTSSASFSSEAYMLCFCQNFTALNSQVLKHTEEGNFPCLSWH